MDPLGLLLGIVAVAVYPGGLFVAAVAWVTQRLGSIPRGTGPDVRGLVASGAAVLAASTASLPGSPAASLPPPGGAAPNLAAAVLLLFAAGSLIAPDPWSVRRRAVVALGAVSLFALGLFAATLSLGAISGTAGGLALTARIVAVLGVIAALPLIVQPHATSGSGAARATVVAATVEVALGLLIPPSQGAAGVLWVVGLVVAAGLYALTLRAVRGAARREHPALVAVAGACAAVATLVAVIAARA